MCVRIDLEKAHKLGYEILQNDTRYLELSCEAREMNGELIVEALQDIEFDSSEIASVMDNIYSISQVKMLKRVIG
jgi:hypothetical protein